MPEKRIVYTRSVTGCHEVVSHKPNDKGYPHFYREGKFMRMSRWIFERVRGSIPEGLIIRHKCDNPLCINVDHLETGTHQDNALDAVLRGRSKFNGERHPKAKLNENAVREIRNSDLTDVE